jgi:diaminohydroxyphosphoribosylaminopyrimidine deaminase/5-amino-6-(5-phosphoribosylamino)uracil reductase
MALRLAHKGLGATSPNPMVGAVVVRGNRVVGRGYHRRAGEPHAEVVALKDAGEKARGATLYVTLEPCNHFGKTPPCTEAVLKAGIRKVVGGMRDPNPRVVGGGFQRLRKAGVEVEVGVLEEACRELNAPFCKYVNARMPFVTLKFPLKSKSGVTKAKVMAWINQRMIDFPMLRIFRTDDALLFSTFDYPYDTTIDFDIDHFMMSVNLFWSLNLMMIGEASEGVLDMDWMSEFED